MNKTILAFAMICSILLAGCQDVTAPQQNTANQVQSSQSNQNQQTSSIAAASSSSITSSTAPDSTPVLVPGNQATCTPIYTMDLQQGQGCTQGGAITSANAPICLEDIKAKQCIGNYCTDGIEKWFTTTERVCTQVPVTVPQDTVKEVPGVAPCTAICSLVQGNSSMEQGKPIAYPNEGAYCLETIQAQGCQGNYCLSSQEKYWTVCK